MSRKAIVQMTPEQLDARMDALYDRMLALVRQLSPEEIENFKAALAEHAQGLSSVGTREESKGAMA